MDAETYATDPYLNDQSFIYLERRVYFYGYEEEEERETRENFGGSETTVTTYSYERKWLEDPQKQSTFQGDSSERPVALVNYDQWIDEMPDGVTNVAETITIGGTPVSSAQLTFSGAKDLELSETLVDKTMLNDNESVSSGIIYRSNSSGTSTPEVPEIGDVKIVFKVITNADRGTYLGAYEEGVLVPFHTQKDNVIHRFFQGVESREGVVDILQSEYESALWMMRLIGFLMMFMGLLLVGKPAFVLISVIRFFFPHRPRTLRRARVRPCHSFLTLLTMRFGHDLSQYDSRDKSRRTRFGFQGHSLFAKQARQKPNTPDAAICAQSFALCVFFVTHRTTRFRV